MEESKDRLQYETGAVRDMPRGKGRYDLLPFHAIDRLAKHYEYGVTDRGYPIRNWEKGLPLWNLLDSCTRHLFKLMAGMNDEDHAAAVMWNIAGFIHIQEEIRSGKLPITLAEHLHPDLIANILKDSALLESKSE